MHHPHPVIPEIVVRGRRKGRCTLCKRRTTRCRLFSQTLHPQNRDAFGNPKTQDQILAKLQSQRDLWIASCPLFCTACNHEITPPPVVTPNPHLPR